jgi:hypothetical protein
MVDHVVWLPTNSGDAAVRAALGAGAGSAVEVTKAESDTKEGAA